MHYYNLFVHFYFVKTVHSYFIILIRASKKNGYYYTPTHPSYNNIAVKNLLVFNSEEAAQKAGYRRAA